MSKNFKMIYERVAADKMTTIRVFNSQKKKKVKMLWLKSQKQEGKITGPAFYRLP